MKALFRAPAKRYVAQNYSPQFLRTLMPSFSACEKVTDREYFVAKPRPKVENLPIGNLVIKERSHDSHCHTTRSWSCRTRGSKTARSHSSTAVSGCWCGFAVHRRSGGRQAHAPPRACAACRRFTRWRIHLERVCVKPFRHCTDGRQCARCQGGSASGLGRTHGTGPRTQDGIRVAPAISTLCRAVAQFQEPRHFGCKWVHY